MSYKAKLPALPAVMFKDPELHRWAKAVSERLEVREGARGDALEQVVTLRDMPAVTAIASQISSADIDVLSERLRNTKLFTSLQKSMGTGSQAGTENILLKIAAEARARQAAIAELSTDITRINRVAANAIIRAMPASEFAQTLQAHLTSGVGNIIAGAGQNYGLVVDGTSVVAKHKDAVYDTTIGTYEGDLRAGLILTATGIAMGYNHPDDGEWINAVAIGATGDITIKGDISATTGTFAGVYSGTVTAGQITTGTLTSADIILGATGRLYTTGRTTATSATAGIFLGQEAGVYKFGISGATGSLLFDGNNLSVTGTISGTSIIGGTVASTVVSNAADALPSASFNTTLQTKLSSGVTNIIAGTGQNYGLVVDGTSVVAKHNLANHLAAVAAYPTGDLKSGLIVTAAGIAMGYNDRATGTWVNAVAIDAAGDITIKGDISATTGTFAGVYSGTVTAGQITTGTLTSADIILGATGRLYTTGRTTATSATAGIFLGQEAGVYKFGISGATGSLLFDGNNLSVTGTISGTSIIGGTVASTVVSNAADALPSASFNTTLQTKLSSGVTNIIAGTGQNYGLVVDGTSVVAKHNLANHLAAVAAYPTGDLKSGLIVTAAGIAMGYNDRATGTWVNAVAIDAAGDITIKGDISATTGTFAGVYSGTVTAGQITTGTLTSADIILGATGRLYTTGRTTATSATAGIFLGQEAGVYKFGISGATGSLLFDGNNLSVTGTISGTSIIGGTVASTVVSNAADALPSASFNTTLQTKLSSGVTNIIAGTGQNYGLVVDGTSVVAKHNLANHLAAVAAYPTGDLKSGLIVTAAGIAMGYNDRATGTWVNAVAIDAAGDITIKGDISATTGTFAGVYSGTVTAGQITTGTLTSADIILGATGRLYTTGRTTATSATAGIFLGQEAGVYKFGISGATGSLLFDGNNLSVTGTISGNSTIGNTLASTVVTNAATAKTATDGLGALAVQNAVDLSTQITGLLANGNVAGLGALALSNSVNLGTQVTGSLPNSSVSGLGALALLGSVNLGTQVTGSLPNSSVSGLGALALSNSVNLGTQVTGSLPNSSVTGLGALALLGSVNLGTATVVGDLAATRIGAGTLAAGVVYANTIAATQISAGTLDAGVIYSGQINATQINAGTLAAGVIYANTIAATQISAGTLAAGVIYAGSIDAVTGTFSGNISTAGQVSASGTTSSAQGNACIVGNSSTSSVSGGVFLASSSLTVGATGYSTLYHGLFGKTGSGSYAAILAQGASASGVALEVVVGGIQMATATSNLSIGNATMTGNANLCIKEGVIGSRLDNQIQIYGHLSDDSDTTLGLVTEQSVVAGTGAFDGIVQIKIYVNGVAYWLPLQAV
jgi:hypothetical protein